MIDLGDTYFFAYNDRRRELFVCGFWVTGKIEVDQIRAYINLIP
jgi:hypothetical protein